MPSLRSGSFGQWFPVVGHEDLPRTVRERGAFLPPPLPRAADVVLTPSANRLLAEAQGALGELKAASTWLPDLAGVVTSLWRVDVGASAALDGVLVSIRELLSYGLPGLATPDLDPRLVPYLDAGEEAVQATRQRRSHDDMLGRLGAIMTGTPLVGAVPRRQHLGWIGGPKAADARLITAPPGVAMRARTRQWSRWVESPQDMPIVGKIALGHLQLMLIHPL